MADHEKSYVPIYFSYGGNNEELLNSAIKKLVELANKYESPLYINAFSGAPVQPPPKPPGGGG